MIASSALELPQRVRVKFCGITCPKDAVAAAALGVDAVGLVFYAASAHVVGIKQAQGIAAVLPPFVSKIGLFVNESEVRIREILHQVPLDLLQFHGDESPEDCALFERPYIKAIAMQRGVDLTQTARRYGAAKGLLVDAYVPGQRGGTGRCFEWSLASVAVDRPLILAGGLTPRNVADAIRAVRPYGVDVSGGIESEKGVKDHRKMRLFMKGVFDASFNSGCAQAEQNR
ncbi:MAG: phosphoribosylanthranilate isomerase [Gammaproteobacteria bacterium]